MGKADLTPPRWLSAGGSLERDGPGLLMRLWLVLELTLLFVGLPLALKHAVHIEKMPLFMVLQPVLLAFIVFLLWDRWFLLRRELVKGFRLSDLGSILAVFLIAEQLTLIATGALAGTGLGVLVSDLFIPFFQVRGGEHPFTPPFVVQIAWNEIAYIYAVFGAMFVAGVIVLLFSLRRMRIFEAVKLGETT